MKRHTFNLACIVSILALALLAPAIPAQEEDRLDEAERAQLEEHMRELELRIQEAMKNVHESMDEIHLNEAEIAEMAAAISEQAARLKALLDEKAMQEEVTELLGEDTAREKSVRRALEAFRRHWLDDDHRHIALDELEDHADHEADWMADVMADAADDLDEKELARLYHYLQELHEKVESHAYDIARHGKDLSDRATRIHLEALENFEHRDWDKYADQLALQIEELTRKSVDIATASERLELLLDEDSAHAIHRDDLKRLMEQSEKTRHHLHKHYEFLKQMHPPKGPKPPKRPEPPRCKIAEHITDLERIAEIDSEQLAIEIRKAIEEVRKAHKDINIDLIVAEEIRQAFAEQAEEISEAAEHYWKAMEHARGDWDEKYGAHWEAIEHAKQAYRLALESLRETDVEQDREAEAEDAYLEALEEKARAEAHSAHAEWAEQAAKARAAEKANQAARARAAERAAEAHRLKEIEELHRTDEAIRSRDKEIRALRREIEELKRELKKLHREKRGGAKTVNETRMVKQVEPVKVRYAVL